jgi:hypothetical protein
MDVIFSTKSSNQNRYSISEIPGYGRLFFEKGIYRTTDKNLIKILLSHPLMKRGDYTLITSEELVEQYLSGDEPETLTEELLNGLNRSGILELKVLAGAKSEQPTLIKAELVGTPITSAIREILDFYKQATEIDEEIKEVQETRKTKAKPKAKVIKQEETE